MPISRPGSRAQKAGSKRLGDGGRWRLPPCHHVRTILRVGSCRPLHVHVYPLHIPIICVPRIHVVLSGLLGASWLCGLRSALAEAAHVPSSWRCVLSPRSGETQQAEQKTHCTYTSTVYTVGDALKYM